jgi:cysteine-rich repeat protein
MEHAQAACGNGVLELGEQCDDDNMEGYDGCDDCRQQQTVIISKMGVEKAGTGWDFGGPTGLIGQWDCVVDNRLAQVEDYRLALKAGMTFAIQSGLAMLYVFDDLDDPLGREDDAITVYTVDAHDVDFDPSNNFDGGAEFQIRQEDMGPDGRPRMVWTGSIHGSRLELATDAYTLTAEMDASKIQFELAHMRFAATLLTDGRRITGLTDALGAGTLTARSMTEFPTAFIEYVAPLANLPPATYPTFLDLIVLGVLELGRSEPFQPDVDLDGDGLEQFFDTDPDDPLSSIDLCIDGDGTEIPGKNCVKDPRIQDGFSIVFSMEGVWARMTGVYP